MTLRDLVKMVHDNAKAHGWWETDREFYEICALIHAEWSEALEEARAGRPMVWNLCNLDGETVCERGKVKASSICNCGNCVYHHDKPEGFAVELIDGVIRILDWIGSINTLLPLYTIDGIRAEAHDCARETEDFSEAKIVNTLHNWISGMYSKTPAERVEIAITIVGIVLNWIAARGLDPMAILLEKHRYNTTRPYKHNKKF